MERFVNYLRDTRQELTHVSWPTQRQAIISTILVVSISIALALFVGAFDFLFTRGVDWFIK